MENTSIEKTKKTTNKNSSVIYSGVFMGILGIAVFVFLYFYSLVQPPKSFPVPSYVEYKEDEAFGYLIEDLYEKKYIKSKTLFKIFIKLTGQETKIKSGSYYFDKPINVSQVAHRFVVGDLNQKLVKITIPEGSTNKDIIKIIKINLPSLSEQKLSDLLKGTEGHNFPDTYFFYPNAVEEEVVYKMQETFDQKVGSFFKEQNLEDADIKKIIILASLLEEEGKSEHDRAMIAGVLLNRIKIGMRLQVDATINYIKGYSGPVSLKDLEIESAYNTYRNEGLPPGPISNPGLESIEAALNPIKSDYLYYLTGKDGNFYFAKTFEEHTVNKQKYLR